MSDIKLDYYVPALTEYYNQEKLNENTEKTKSNIQILSDKTEVLSDTINKLVNDQSQPDVTLSQDNSQATISKNNSGQGRVEMSGQSVTNLCIPLDKTWQVTKHMGCTMEYQFENREMVFTGNADQEGYIVVTCPVPISLESQTEYTQWAKIEYSGEGYSRTYFDMTATTGGYDNIGFWQEDFAKGLNGKVECTSDLTDKIVYCRFVVRNLPEGETIKISCPMVEKGDTTSRSKRNVMGTQATSHIALDTRGKNLFNKAHAKKGYRINTNNEEISDQDFYLSEYIPVNAGQKIIQPRPATICAFVDRDYKLITTTTSYPATVPDGAYAFRIYADYASYPIDEYQIEFGEVMTDYEAFHGTTLYFDEALTGDEMLTLYEDGHAKIKKHTKYQQINGVDYDWENMNLSVAVGYKFVRTTTQMFNDWIGANHAVVTKYNGLNLEYNGNASKVDTFIDYSENTSYPYRLGIAVSSTDSGWGEDYTPEVDEINAYFNGWVMATADTNALYNDNAKEKVWYKRDIGIGSTLYLPFGAAVEQDSKITVCPKEKAYGEATKCYEIRYTLVQPETYEKYVGSLQLSTGQNHVTVLTGRVKEKANFTTHRDGSRYYVNVFNHPNTEKNSLQSNAVKRILRLTTKSSSGEKDVTSLFLNETSYAFGEERTSASSGDITLDEMNNLYIEYDSVSNTTDSGIYTAVLTYKDALPDTVENNSKAISQASKMLSGVVAEIAEMKDVKVCEPTLLNGWSEYSTDTPVSYSIDYNNVVRLDGAIKGGTKDVKVMALPRPKVLGKYFQVYGSGGEIVSGVITSSGELKISEGDTTLVPLFDISYEAGE